MAWTDAQQNPHDYLAPGAGVGYSGGISGQYPIGLGVGNYAGALRLGGAPSASSVPNPTARPTLPGSLMPLPIGRPSNQPGPFGAVGQAGPRGATNAAPVNVSQALAASAGKLSSSQEAAIRQEAARLGIAPSNLAAVMDFESGLSTTRTNPYGYKGLIQFGPGEQKTYGYQPGQSFEQQLFGPVHNYLTDRGLPAGASLSTLYRTINGGNPNASLQSRDANGGTIADYIAGINAGVLPKYAYLDNGFSGQGAADTMYGGTMPNPNMRPGRTTDARGGLMSPSQFLSAVGPQPRPIGPNDYLVPAGQNIDALTYTNEPAASPTNAVFRLPNANTPPPVSPAATPSIAGGQPYTVKPNDTLWGIAAQTLGDPTQWPTIAQANGIRRGQERNIQPGQQLMIPGGTPAGPPPMPNTTAQGLGPMPPVPTPQARPSIPAPGIPDPRLRPGNQPGPFSSVVPRETAAPSVSSQEQPFSMSPGGNGASVPSGHLPLYPEVQQAMGGPAPTDNRPLTPLEQWFTQKAIEYGKARLGNRPGPFAPMLSSAGTGPDQFRFANAGLGQQTTRMGLQPGILPQLPEPVGGRQPSAEDQYRLATAGSGNQTTNMSMQPYTLPQLPFPNLPTDTPWGNVPTRQQAQTSPPAGPGMDLSGYIPPISRMEKALGNVPMALPTQQTPMDPNVAAAISRIPAIISDQNASPTDSRGNLATIPEVRSGYRMEPRVFPGISDVPSSNGFDNLPNQLYGPANRNRAITDRDIRIITARTPPVYVAPDGSRVWYLGPIIASNEQQARAPEDRGPTDATLRQRGSASRRNMNMDIGVQQTTDRLRRDHPERFLPGAPPLNENFINVTPYTSPVRRLGFPTDT